MGKVGLVRHFAGRFMTRKSRIEMKDDHRNGNNQKFGKHSACHKIHHGVSLARCSTAARAPRREWPIPQRAAELGRLRTCADAARVIHSAAFLAASQR